MSRTHCAGLGPKRVARVVLMMPILSLLMAASIYGYELLPRLDR